MRLFGESFEAAAATAVFARIIAPVCGFSGCSVEIREKIKVFNRRWAMVSLQTLVTRLRVGVIYEASLILNLFGVNPD